VFVGDHGTDRWRISSLGVAEAGANPELSAVVAFNPDRSKHTLKFALAG